MITGRLLLRDERALLMTIPRNILYINSSAVMYGAETRLLDITQNLDRNKFRPFVLLPTSGPFEVRLKALGVTTQCLDFIFTITKSPIFRFLRLTRDFVRLARQHNIDIIHCNMHFKASNFWLAFLILRKPVIIHIRSHYYIHVFEKFMMCRVSKVICISEAVKRAFLQRRRSSYLMFHRYNQAEIVYDGIDTNKFCPKDTGGIIRKELGINPSDFLVALIGAIDRVKGQDTLIKAADIVVRKHPQAKFVIVGDIYADSPRKNKYRLDVIQLIKDLNLEKQVILTGFRNDIDIFMNEIDLLAQPSEREALGTSMVEAMACGKPVIGTNVDGVPEVVGDNEAGILLNPRTPEELAKDIIFFIENRQETEKRGRQGRERALRMFDVQKNIKLIQEIYSQTLNHL